MRRWIGVLWLLPLIACGSSSPAGPTPVPTPTPQPPPRVVTVSGTITDTVSGAPVGAFSQDTSGLPALLTVSAAGHLTRQAWVASASPTVDLIPDAAPFSIDFYRMFARGTFEDPIQPLRLQATAPRLYLRTSDESGTPIDNVTLTTVETAMQSVAASFTGGRFGLAGVERGTGTHEGEPGWITVKWTLATDSCGLSFVGGTVIELHPYSTVCACNGSRIRPLTAKHELGHAMGFYHTGDRADLMSGLSVSGCDLDPSPRERYHAAIAYHRASGNRDVDQDAAGGSFSTQRIVVVD